MKQHEKLPPLIVIGAGGTGGHMFPAEALIRELLEQNYRICLMTDERGTYFSNLKNVENFQILPLKGGGIASGSKLQKIQNAWGLLQSVFSARRWFKQHKPDAAIGFGGFASVPAVMGAKLTRTPFMIHEQNAALGRANRLVASSATYVATGFEHVRQLPKNANQRWVGTPLRQAFTQESSYQDPKDQFHLLILGGSQGAAFFNEIIPKALSLLPTQYQTRLHVTQQVRAEYMKETQALWTELSINHELAPFFDNVAERMQKADLYIGRSGAGAMNECLASALPSIMIPYPYAVDDHQYYNAKNLEDAGCGYVIRQQDLNAEILAQKIQILMDDPSLLQQQKHACTHNAKTQATKELAHMVRTMVKIPNN